MSWKAERPPAMSRRPEGAKNDADASFLPGSGHEVNDNSASAQRARVLAALRRGSLTTLEARRLLDVLHSAARVMELRRAGWPIVTVWAEDVTSEGKAHRVARYLLRGDRS